MRRYIFIFGKVSRSTAVSYKAEANQLQQFGSYIIKTTQTHKHEEKIEKTHDGNSIPQSSTEEALPCSTPKLGPIFSLSPQRFYGCALSDMPRRVHQVACRCFFSVIDLPCSNFSHHRFQSLQTLINVDNVGLQPNFRIISSSYLLAA